MKIEEVTINDAKELLTIYAPYVLDTAVSFEYDVPTLSEFEERIEHKTKEFPWLKAVENGKILGYCYASRFIARAAYDWSVETTIYVSKNERRKGIGRALYSALEEKLREMGILNLNACIAEPKEDDPHLTMDSIRFHEKMGYTMVGRFHDSGYKFQTWYHMVWMEKMIGEHTKHPKTVDFGTWSHNIL